MTHVISYMNAKIKFITWNLWNSRQFPDHKSGHIQHLDLPRNHKANMDFRFEMCMDAPWDQINGVKRNQNTHLESVTMCYWYKIRHEINFIPPEEMFNPIRRREIQKNSLVSNNKPLIRSYSIAYVRYIFPFWIVRPIIIRIIPILIFTGTKEVNQRQVRVFPEFFQEFKIEWLIWIFKTMQHR